MAFEYPKRVRFKCVKCGICCGDTKERTRHVLLLDEEADRIASTIRKPISDFASTVKDKPPYHHEMKKTVTEGKCIFLKENRCTIYSKRPLICRFYPFGLETRQEQRKVFYFSGECPGIGKGRTMGENDFRKLLRQASPRRRRTAATRS
jgi:Fe-S-cluster containining protein